MMIHTMAFASALTWSAGLAFQEDESGTADAPATIDGAQVAHALEESLDGDSFHLTGRVSKVDAGADGGFGGAVIVVSGQGAGSPEFVGGVHLMRREGSLLIVSDEELPGLAVLDNGTTRVTQVTTGSDGLDASTVAGDLPDLLRMGKLLPAVEAASWRSAPQPDGGSRLTTELPCRLLASKAPTGPNGMQMPGLSKEVERIETSILLDGQGAIVELEFTAVRFDPNAAMSRRFREGGLQSGAFQPGDLEVPDEERVDSDFQRDVYTLKWASKPVSPRMNKLFADLSIVAAKDGF